MINTEEFLVIPIQKLCYITKANMPSREFNDRTEWSLFDNMLKQFAPDSKLQILISLLPGLMLSLRCIVHENVIQKRSLLMSLGLIGPGVDYYVFQPFSLLQKCIRKIKQDKAKAIALVIDPVWPTQTWFPLLMNIIRRSQ